jgi:hypothetical protein
MSWTKFLEMLCIKSELTPSETEVLMCLEPNQCPSKQELLKIYIERYSIIEDEAFTQRLKNIYKKLNITSNGHKLPQLHKYIFNQYSQERNKDIFFSEIGLSYIYYSFPKDAFKQELERMIDSEDLENKQIDILQTFAPNLDDYYRQLIESLEHNIKVRILLAWPYSQAAKLREDVLKKYANSNIYEEIDIRDRVIANLETLEKIIKFAKNSHLLELKLYDTLPSLAIYRAGNYMLVAPFLHGSLAVDTFQFELKLNSVDRLIVKTLQKDFDLMWEVARRFDPAPNQNWRNDLKILFTD